MDLASFTRLDRIFLLCAALGSIVALFRVLFQFVGGELGEDAPELDDLGALGPGFRYLSLHGLSSFFMMFGLALNPQGAGAGASILGGLAAGSWSCRSSRARRT